MGGFSTSVVVDDLDIDRSKLRPTKANPILLVDADCTLTSTVAAQLLEPIARRKAQIFDGGRSFEVAEFALCDRHQGFRNERARCFADFPSKMSSVASLANSTLAL